MTPLINKCYHQAEKLHNSVVYGGGLVMLDQVKGTARWVEGCSQLTGTDKEVVMCAALLHKCFESKRIADGVQPMTMDDVEKLAGPKVRSIVEELASEPETEGLSKEEQWKEKAEWAKGLSKEAQEILLAEKIMNFRVSRDRPNPKKPLAWHKQYYETRMLMVDALREANPELYRIAVQTKDAGLSKIQAMQKTMENSGRNGH